MTNEISGPIRPSNLVLFAWLMGASVVAIGAMSPALLFLLDPARKTPLAHETVDPVRFVIAFGVANIFLSAIAITIGLYLEPSVRMGVPMLRHWLTTGSAIRSPASAILVHCSALAVGLAAIVLMTAILLRSHLPNLPDNFVFPPVWQGILMMLGAAVREEILFRFFALNLFTWLAMKILRQREPTAAIVWTANILVALVFAALHLVPAAQLLHLNAIAITAAITLASLASALFGWVYWRHGLTMAIFTHAVAGVLVYVGARGMIAFAS